MGTTPLLPILEEARSLLREVLNGPANPMQVLVDTGAFPPGWPECYLRFLERATEAFPPATPLPREVAALIYLASAYFTKRYHDYQTLTGRENEATRQLTDQVRWAGDKFMLLEFWELPATGSGTP